MNTETPQEFGQRIDGMLAMGFLSTIPKLRCASDIASPIADAIRAEQCVVDEPCDPLSNPVFPEGWYSTTGGGLYDVVGWYGTKFLTSVRLLEIVRKGKKILVYGEDAGEFVEMCSRGLGEDVVKDWFYHIKDNNGIPFSLIDEDDALELRDIITTQPIGAIIALHQEGKLEHLDLITNVPVYRGKEQVYSKKVPVFHVQCSEPFVFNSGFGKVVKPVTVNEEERRGCTQAASSITKEHREWLWPGDLGRKKLTHFGGASSAGKSPVTLDLIARLPHRWLKTMRDIDPDVLAACKTIFEARRNSHLGKVRAKHSKQVEARFETQIELLCDEVEKVIDPKHPAFLLVLALAVMEKVSKATTEPEYKSCLDSFPQNW